MTLKSLSRSKALRIAILALLLQFSTFHNIFAIHPYEAVSVSSPARPAGESGAASSSTVPTGSLDSGSPLSEATTPDSLLEEVRSLDLTQAEENLNPETEALASLETFVQSLNQRETRLEEILTELPSLLPNPERRDTEEFNTFPSDWVNKKPSHVKIQSGALLLQGTGVNYQAQAFERDYLSYAALPTYTVSFRADSNSFFTASLEGQDTEGNYLRFGIVVGPNGRTRIQIVSPEPRTEIPQVFLPFNLAPALTYTLEFQVEARGIALRLGQEGNPRSAEPLFFLEDPDFATLRFHTWIRQGRAQVFSFQKSWLEEDPRLLEVESIHSLLQSKRETSEESFLLRNSQTLILTPEEEESPFPPEEASLETLVQSLGERTTELESLLPPLESLLGPEERTRLEEFNTFPSDWTNPKPSHVTIRDGRLRLQGTGINFQSQAYERRLQSRNTNPTTAVDFRADRGSFFTLALQGNTNGTQHRFGIQVQANGRTRILIRNSFTHPQAFLPFSLNPTRIYTAEFQADSEGLALRVWEKGLARPEEALYFLKDSLFQNLRLSASIRSYTGELLSLTKTWNEGTPEAILNLQEELEALQNRTTLAQVHLDLLNALDNIPRLTNQTSLTLSYTWLGQERSQTVSLDQEGANSFTITELDSLGRTVTASLTITRDTVPPEILSTSVLFTNQTNYTLNYTVDGIAQSQDFTLVEGENPLTITSTDLAGNTTTETFTVTYDPNWVREERSWLLGDKNLTLILNPFPGEETYQSDLAQWTQDEVTELLPILGEIIPAINLVYGNPFLSAAYSIAPLRNRTGGWFDRISVAIGVTASSGVTGAMHVLVHELAHAFDT